MGHLKNILVLLFLCCENSKKDVVWVQNDHLKHAFMFSLTSYNPWLPSTHNLLPVSVYILTDELMDVQTPEEPDDFLC